DSDDDQEAEKETERTEASQVFRRGSFRTRTVERDRSGGSGSRTENHAGGSHAKKRFTNNHLWPFLPIRCRIIRDVIPSQPNPLKNRITQNHLLNALACSRPSKLASPCGPAFHIPYVLQT